MNLAELKTFLAGLECFEIPDAAPLRYAPSTYDLPHQRELTVGGLRALVAEVERLREENAELATRNAELKEDLYAERIGKRRVGW